MDTDHTIDRNACAPIARALTDVDGGTDVEALERLLEAHPTCALAAALVLRHGGDLPTELTAKLRGVVALGAADRQAFGDFANINGADWYGFYPSAVGSGEKTTDEVLAAFINSYGHSSAEEDALIERLIFNPVAPDYFDVAEDGDLSGYDDLLGGAPAPVDEAPVEAAPEPEPVADAPIDAPVDAPVAPIEEPSDPVEVPIEPSEQKAAPEPPIAPVDTSLMESLAKIFVKQGRYSRAFEIISNLNLKYPEKSVYFADQLRFLQKLMVNQQYQQQSKQ